MENRWEYQVGGLVLDMRRIEARIDGGPPVQLSRREWAVLLTLTQHPGMTINARRLVGDVMMYPTDVEAAKTAKSWVARLRRKLGDPPTHPRFIHSRKGFGYMLEDRGSQPAPEPQPKREPLTEKERTERRAHHPWRTGL